MTPTAINYESARRMLRLTYENSRIEELSAEYLRVYSPSAEVRGHSDAQRVLQTGKKQVGISNLVAVGNYAIRITFTDGHDTGIYSWDYFKELIDNKQAYWQKYLEDLEAANASRLPAIPLGQWTPKINP